MNRKLSIVILGLLAALWIPSQTIGGLLRVSCDPGTSVTVVWIDDETGVHTDHATDVNGDGIVEFGIPRQDHIMVGVSIGKTSDGRTIVYTIDLNVGGVTLASLEPFDVPTFAAVNPDVDLIAVIDIAGFLAEGNPFSIGNILTVTGGSIPETDRITFKDGTGQAVDPVDVLNPDFLDSLPEFSGSAEVMPFDTFCELPSAADEMSWGKIKGLYR